MGNETIREGIIRLTRKLIIYCINTGGWSQQRIEEHADEILKLFEYKDNTDWAGLDPVKWAGCGEEGCLEHGYKDAQEKNMDAVRKLGDINITP